MKTKARAQAAGSLLWLLACPALSQAQTPAPATPSQVSPSTATNPPIAAITPATSASELTITANDGISVIQMLPMPGLTETSKLVVTANETPHGITLDITAANIPLDELVRAIAEQGKIEIVIANDVHETLKRPVVLRNLTPKDALAIVAMAQGLDCSWVDAGTYLLTHHVSRGSAIGIAPLARNDVLGPRLPEPKMNIIKPYIDPRHSGWEPFEFEGKKYYDVPLGTDYK